MSGVDLLDRAGETLGGALPRFAGALVLLVVGLLAARLVGRLLRRMLERAGADRLAERWGVRDALAQVGITRPLSRLIGTGVRLTLAVVVVFAALSLLGLQFLSASLNAAVLFVPRLLTALALLLAGIVVAGLARERVERLAWQMDFPVPLGRLVQVAVLAIAGVTALTQVGVPTEVLTALVNILLAAAALTVTLAFGLGGRDVARAVNAGRYVRGSFTVGDTIAVEGVRGEIERIDSVATVLRGDGDRRVHVPNHMLIDSLVTVDAAGAGGAPERG